MYGRTCGTSVKTGLESPMFQACGKPSTEAVAVGLRVCHYCAEHAAAARRFVEQQGQSKIVGIQRGSQADE